MTFLRRALTVALLSALVVNPLVGSAADPFEIDAIMPLTGGGAFLGRSGVDMLNVVEGIVNGSGGIGGRPLKFAVHDDASSPQQAVQIMNEIIAKHAAVVIGPELVANCNAVEPLTHAGPVVYCVSTGAHPEDGSYMFSCGVSTTDLMALSVRYLRERGLKKIAVLTSTDATGQDADRMVDGLFAEPENRDAQIVAREHFAPSDVSVTAQLTRVRASGAQALIAWTTGSPMGTVLRGMGSIGLDLPLVGGPGNLTYAQMKAYANILAPQTLFPATPAIVADSLPEGPVKKASTELAKSFKTAGLRPDTGNVMAWDAVFLMVDGLRKLGTNATAAQLRDYIVRARFSGVSGRYDFKAHPQRGLDASTAVMVRWDAARDSWVAVSQLGGKPL